MLLAVTQAVRINGINEHDGLIHNADGSRSFPDGKKEAVGGVNAMDNTSTFKGPVPDRFTNMPEGMRHIVDIVKDAGNGQVGGQYPYTPDSTGFNKNDITTMRKKWDPPAATKKAKT